MQITVQARRDEAVPLRCAVCHDALATPAWACEACGAQAHPECGGDCPTLGCPRRGRCVLRIRTGQWRRVADRQRFRALMGGLMVGLAIGGVAATSLPVGPSVLVALALGAAVGATVGLVGVVVDGLLIPARLDPRREALPGQGALVGLSMLFVAWVFSVGVVHRAWLPRPGLSELLWCMHLPALLSGLTVTTGVTGVRAISERLSAWTDRRRR